MGHCKRVSASIESFSAIATKARERWMDVIHLIFKCMNVGVIFKRLKWNHVHVHYVMIWTPWCAIYQWTMRPPSSVHITRDTETEIIVCICVIEMTMEIIIWPRTHRPFIAYAAHSISLMERRTLSELRLVIRYAAVLCYRCCALAFHFECFSSEKNEFVWMRLIRQYICIH